MAVEVCEKARIQLDGRLRAQLYERVQVFLQIISFINYLDRVHCPAG